MAAKKQEFLFKIFILTPGVLFTVKVFPTARSGAIPPRLFRLRACRARARLDLGLIDTNEVIFQISGPHISKPCSTTALGDCSRVVEHLRFGPDTKAPVAPRAQQLLSAGGADVKMFSAPPTALHAG